MAANTGGCPGTSAPAMSQAATVATADFATCRRGLRWDARIPAVTFMPTSVGAAGERQAGSSDRGRGPTTPSATLALPDGHSAGQSTDPRTTPRRAGVPGRGEWVGGVLGQSRRRAARDEGDRARRAL